MGVAADLELQFTVVETADEVVVDGHKELGFVGQNAAVFIVGNLEPAGQGVLLGADVQADRGEGILDCEYLGVGNALVAGHAGTDRFLTDVVVDRAAADHEGLLDRGDELHQIPQALAVVLDHDRLQFVAEEVEVLLVLAHRDSRVGAVFDVLGEHGDRGTDHRSGDCDSEDVRFVRIHLGFPL